MGVEELLKGFRVRGAQGQAESFFHQVQSCVLAELVSQDSVKVRSQAVDDDEPGGLGFDDLVDVPGDQVAIFIPGGQFFGKSVFQLREPIPNRGVEKVGKVWGQVVVLLVHPHQLLHQQVVTHLIYCKWQKLAERFGQKERRFVH